MALERHQAWTSPQLCGYPLSPAAGELCEQNPGDEYPLLGRRPSSQQLRAQGREGEGHTEGTATGLSSVSPRGDIRPGRSRSGWHQLDAALSRGGYSSRSEKGQLTLLAVNGSSRRQGQSRRQQVHAVGKDAGSIRVDINGRELQEGGK